MSAAAGNRFVFRPAPWGAGCSLGACLRRCDTSFIGMSGHCHSCVTGLFSGRGQILAGGTLAEVITEGVMAAPFVLNFLLASGFSRAGCGWVAVRRFAGTGRRTGWGWRNPSERRRR